jgi:hypothetical protein
MSEVKVNKISPRSGTTVTLGDSGDTFTIPSGATINNQGTATNFGATGSASWVTTVKTSTFTAVAGEGYFVNTTGGAVTVNLPAGVAGAVVAIKDYAGTFDTNAVTVAPNGSDKIGGDNTTDGTLSTEGIAVTFVFVDSTQGWLVTDSGLQDELPTAQYIVATGGTITCSGNFKIHTFTGPGTFTVCAVGNAGGSNTIDYMVVAGGGGGGGSARGFYSSGGGGAGGYRESPGAASGCYSVSPLGTAPAAALPVTATGYPVTVGGGGTAGTGSGPGTAPSGRGDGGNGNPSTFAGTTTITSTAGGGGSKSGGAPAQAGGSGAPGGSGGGVGGYSSGSVGTGNTPPTNPSQGNNGGTGDGSSRGYGGAGGGATAVGQPSDIQPTHGALGGTGATSCITASPVARATGGPAGTPSTCAAANAADNTGNGGPGGNNQPSGDATGGNGGSGIVVIRYKYQ